MARSACAFPAAAMALRACVVCCAFRPPHPPWLQWKLDHARSDIPANAHGPLTSWTPEARLLHDYYAGPSDALAMNAIKVARFREPIPLHMLKSACTFELGPLPAGGVFVASLGQVVVLDGDRTMCCVSTVLQRRGGGDLGRDSRSRASLIVGFGAATRSSRLIRLPGGPFDRKLKST